MASGSYRIKIEGHLDDKWSGRLGGMAIARETSETGSPTTTLYGELPDEAALSGVLTALYDLGYGLESVEKTGSDAGATRSQAVA